MDTRVPISERAEDTRAFEAYVKDVFPNASLAEHDVGQHSVYSEPRVQYMRLGWAGGRASNITKVVTDSNG